MNRLFLVAAAATSVITFYSATSANAEQTIGNAPVSIATERFDAGPAPMPLADGAGEIMFEDGAEFYEHDLNDAWLGMPFKGLQGDVIGYVIDAPVNEYGEVAEVHVGEPSLDWKEDDAGHVSETDEPLVFKADQVALMDDAVVLLPTESELVATLTK